MKVVTVAAGTSHSAAVTQDGAVWTWALAATDSWAKTVNRATRRLLG